MATPSMHWPWGQKVKGWVIGSELGLGWVRGVALHIDTNAYFFQYIMISSISEAAIAKFESDFCHGQ